MNTEIKWSFIVFENNFYLWLWEPLRLLQGHLKKSIVRGDIILRKTECFFQFYTLFISTEFWQNIGQFSEDY